MRSIYIAAAALSIMGVAATETAHETKSKTHKKHRLRRTSRIVKVENIEEAEQRKQKEAAVESIKRIIYRSNDDDDDGEKKTRSGNKHKNRQLITAGTIAEINHKKGIQEEDVFFLMAHVLERNGRTNNDYHFSMPVEPVSTGGIIINSKNEFRY